MVVCLTEGPLTAEAVVFVLGGAHRVGSGQPNVAWGAFEGACAFVWPYALRFGLTEAIAQGGPPAIEDAFASEAVVFVFGGGYLWVIRNTGGRCSS